MPFDPFSTRSDADLLALYASGDRKASAELTSRLLPRVYSHASRVLGDASEAEDVAQEAMMRLWRIAPEWRRGDARVSTWLFRVTANLCTDRLRRRRNVPIDDGAELPDDAPSAYARVQELTRRDALQAALAELPDRQRQCVLLRHIEGLANAEIGEILDISPRAVESLTARGKKTLAAILEGQKDALGYENDTE